ncbi:MAG: hypothetical protein MJ059_04985 [Lachnospiraceae bacterium]|nr:hypothetical protein [Lachnospiraceae bacterium]
MKTDTVFPASGRREVENIKRIVKCMFFLFVLSFTCSMPGYAGDLTVWMERAKEVQAEMMNQKAENIPDSSVVCETRGKAEERLISAFSALSDGRPREVWVIGKDIIPVGTCLKEHFGENAVYSNDSMDIIENKDGTYHVHRFVIQKKNLKEGKDNSMDTYKMPDAKNHWEVGDETGAFIDGNPYFFTCIDSDYKGGALFLCNTVIPADFGTDYEIYYSPGPIGYFGETNDYETSKIRSFLDSQTASYMKRSLIGINESASGSTMEGKFGATDSIGVKRYSIGFQQITQGLFIFSLNEAIMYAKWLWRFEGSESDNPKTVLSPFLSAYWLRTPYGNGFDYESSDMVYVVDLEKGNIHPASVRPESSVGDDYTDLFTAVGIRPAFVLDND